MDRLPFHLINEILFRLDPISLVMVQCTGRSLHSHISDDPYFGSEYLSRLGPGLFHTCNGGSILVFSCPYGDCRSFKSNWPSLQVRFHVLASYSGLLLLFIDGFGLCVANPLTKRFCIIDHTKSKHFPEISPGLGDQQNRIGFAVDHIDGTTQRFRIVCIASNPDQTMYRFEINSGDSSWRLSESIITCSSSDLMTKPVYLDDTLYWLRNDGSIIAFNPETEQARLIRIEFPPKQFWKTLFTEADNELILIMATTEVIFVYALKDNLTDPKWILVRWISNRVVGGKNLGYWNVTAYDGKRLVLMVRGITTKGGIHRYDLRTKEWGVMSPFAWSGFNDVQDFFLFKPSLCNVIQLDENEKLVCDDKRLVTISRIMRLIGGITPYALNVLKRKKTILEKRLMIEEEEKRV